MKYLTAVLTLTLAACTTAKPPLAPTDFSRYDLPQDGTVIESSRGFAVIEYAKGPTAEQRCDRLVQGFINSGLKQTSPTHHAKNVATLYVSDRAEEAEEGDASTEIECTASDQGVTVKISTIVANH